MGCALSSPVSDAGIVAASDDELKKAVGDMPDDVRKKLAGSCKYTIYYHAACTKFYGRAFPLVLCLETVGAEYECFEPGAAPEGTGFVCAPAIKSPSGACIAQLPAQLLMLGEELSMAPKDPVLRAKHCQLILDANDLLGEIFGGKDDERLKKWMDYLEKTITATPGVFLVGDKVTPADFFMYFTFLWVDKKEKKSLYESCTGVKKFMAAVENTPAYKKLMAPSVGIAAIPG